MLDCLFLYLYFKQKKVKGTCRITIWVAKMLRLDFSRNPQTGDEPHRWKHHVFFSNMYLDD